MYQQNIRSRIDPLFDERYQAIRKFNNLRLKEEVKSPDTHEALIELGSTYREERNRYEADLESWKTGPELKPYQVWQKINEYLGTSKRLFTKFQETLSNAKIPFHEESDHLSIMESWTHNDRSKDYFFACFGKVNENAHNVMGEYQEINTNIYTYKQDMSYLHVAFDQAWKDNEFGKARDYARQYAAKNGAFEEFLKKWGYLE